MRNRNQQSGFTLLEAVIAMALLSSAMLVATLSFVAITRLQSKSTTVRQVQQDGRYAFDTIVRDIHNASTIVVNSPTSLSLTEALIANGTVDYSYDATSQQITRKECVGNQGTTTGPPCTSASLAGSNTRIAAINYRQVPGGVKPTIEVDMTVKQQDTSRDSLSFDPFQQTYNLTTLVTPRGY